MTSHYDYRSTARRNSKAIYAGAALNPNMLGSYEVERIIRRAVRNFDDHRIADKPKVRPQDFKSFRALYVSFPKATGCGKTWTPTIRFILTKRSMRGAQVILICDDETMAPYTSKVLKGTDLREALFNGLHYAGIDTRKTGEVMATFLNSLQG